MVGFFVFDGWWIKYNISWSALFLLSDVLLLRTNGHKARLSQARPMILKGEGTICVPTAWILLVHTFREATLGSRS